MKPLRVFAHHPKVMVGYAALEMASERPIESRRASSTSPSFAPRWCGCEWCLDFGSSISVAAGIGDEVLRELPGYDRSERFMAAEKLVLDYATSLPRSPVKLPDALFDQFARALR